MASENVSVENASVQHGHVEHAHPTVATFLKVWIALLIATGLTVWVATFNLGPWSALVALIIATVKALLVLLFFMELRYSTALTKVAVISAFFFLVILAGLTLSDYLTRTWGTYGNSFR